VFGCCRREEGHVPRALLPRCRDRPSPFSLGATAPPSPERYGASTAGQCETRARPCAALSPGSVRPGVNSLGVVPGWDAFSWNRNGPRGAVICAAYVLFPCGIGRFGVGRNGTKGKGT